MRWRRSRGNASLPASVALLLLPLFLTAPQQLSRAQPLDVQHHDDGTGWVSSAQVSGAPGPTGHTSSVIVDDNNAYTHFRNTHPHNNNVKNSDDASALVMALAGSGRAVRDPPAQPSPSGGVPQLHARSLQDWEVEDFVLLATVDGSIHARDRKTGAPRWALEVPSSPMVESIYHRANRTRGTGPDRLRSIDAEPATSEDDFIWIVEPSRDGSLYIYSPGENGGGLQRLGLTVKELVDETPYSGLDPAVTYTARKETTLYTVDARTGSILRVFSSRGPITPEQSCRAKRPGEQSDDDDELANSPADCDTSAGTLTLGRIEYAVAIQDTETGEPICTLKYTEWTSNNRDMDLQSQYHRTMDQSHIYSMHDGVILGFDHSGKDRPRYTQRFPSPVVRVFDVVRQITDEAKDQPAPLILLSQPLDPPDPDRGPSLDERQRVFIDCTDAGGWYAMSESTYPLVTTRAVTAQCYEKDYFRDGHSLFNLDLKRQREALAGLHSLKEEHIQQARTDAAHGRHRNGLLSISDAGSSSDLQNDTPRDISGSPSIVASPPALRNSVIINNALDIFVTILLLFLGLFVYLNSHHLQAIVKQKLDLKNIIDAYGQPLPTPSTPVIGSRPTVTRQTPVSEDAPTARTRPETPQKIAVDVIDYEVAAEEGESTPRLSRATSQSPAPDATPKVRIREPSQGADGDEDVDDLNLQKPEKKKKARRGVRGGKGHKRKPKPGSDEGTSLVDKMVDQVKTLPPPARLEPDIQLARTVSNEIVEMDGAIRIGQLKVYTDKVLGHGSHGTVVYKGSFDGRDVAVKRMLVEFFDIASHEVGLLQESDDHSNVIRYYCREQAAGFLYIALELCPASLQEVVEKPADYPQLVGAGLDVPEVLYQITAGVRYLHSLKIVHRDLKPQNILVAAPRGRVGYPTLRLLISDFGLCKKLEDNQSSFRATTAHAAGTSGWRAPELLVDDDMNPATTNGNGITESQHTESSEPAVVDPQTNRRATRAIDIFSLGCVFYYVLTRGGHPYDKDGKFMREANIVKGNHNLDDLQKLGDYAFEADDLIRRMLSLEPRNR